MNTQQKYTEYLRDNQLFSPLDYIKFELSVNDPVFTLIEIIKEMEFDELIKLRKDNGRTGYNPIMIFALLLYANMQGIRSTDEIVKRCERDLGFIYLTRGARPKRDVFYDFKRKIPIETLEDLHYQFIKFLNKEGYVTLENLYVDGTKIEANANRYTFVWRGTINYHLINLLIKTRTVMEDYNNLIKEKSYAEKYQIKPEKMFIIEGTEKVTKIIQENKERKKINKKKLSNNLVLKIDNIGPTTLNRMSLKLKSVIEGENIEMVSGKGSRPTKIQKLYEQIFEIGSKLVTYKEHFEIMGADRNSYSKTDFDATFMRMKDDHMLNGQLKAAYNLQIGVENYFVIDTSISNDRNDYATLIPLITKHTFYTNSNLKQLTADSGYSSEQNLTFLKNNSIKPFIKTQNHEQRKTRKYQNSIGKHYNMEILPDGDEIKYQCHDGRYLKFVHAGYRTTGGFKREYKKYECKNCEGCKFKKACFYNYNEERDNFKNKSMKVYHNDYLLKEESHQNIISDEGIFNRMVRSIQTEGTFGDMKENDGFRRFNNRSTEKVYKEVLFYFFGKNIKRLHSFKHNNLQEFTLDETRLLC